MESKVPLYTPLLNYLNQPQEKAQNPLEVIRTINNYVTSWYKGSHEMHMTLKQHSECSFELRKSINLPYIMWQEPLLHKVPIYHLMTPTHHYVIVGSPSEYAASVWHLDWAKRNQNKAFDKEVAQVRLTALKRFVLKPVTPEKGEHVTPWWIQQMKHGRFVHRIERLPVLKSSTPFKHYLSNDFHALAGWIRECRDKYSLYWDRSKQQVVYMALNADQLKAFQECIIKK